MQIEANKPQAKPRRTWTSGSLEDLNLCFRLFLLLVGPLGGDVQPSRCLGSTGASLCREESSWEGWSQRGGEGRRERKSQ